MENLINKNFTVVPNELINDRNISRDARFLFVYLASKPPGWKFYTATIEKELNCSSDSRKKYMLELVTTGWITREQIKQDNGEWGAMALHLHPQPKISATVDLPQPKISAADKNGGGKNRPHSNTDKTKKELSNNKTDDVLLFEIPTLPEEILKYLNKKKGITPGYRITAANMTEIKARIKDGFKSEDFITVIDAAVKNWGNDPERKKYIRPETLFGKKFNNYLIEATESTPGPVDNKIKKDGNNTKENYRFSAADILAEAGPRNTI